MKPEPGPQLTLAERDRRYAGLRALMEKQGFDAIVVGSFQGRERLESYLIDDFLDAVVVLPMKSEPVLLLEKGVLEKCKAHLEAEKPLRELELTAEERKPIGGFLFLSATGAQASSPVLSFCKAVGLS